MTAVELLGAPQPLARSTWAPVCSVSDLVPERGVCAALGGRQVAVFLLADGAVRAVHNRDPFSGAYVLSRGVVGSRGDVPVCVSPMYKQAFDLRTGICLDDPVVRIDVFGARVRDGIVEVAVGR